MAAQRPCLEAAAHGFPTDGFFDRRLLLGVRTPMVFVLSIVSVLVVVTSIFALYITFPGRMDGALIALCNDRLMSQNGDGDWSDRLMQWYLLLFVFKTRCEEDVHDTPGPLQAVRAYRYARAHVGIREAQTDVRWWHNRVLYLRGVSIYADPGTFVRIQKGQHHGVEYEVVFVSEQNNGKCFEDSASQPPSSLPVVEIDEMTVGWRSWREPVLDLRMDGLAVNVLFDLTKSKTEGSSPFSLPFSFRNNSLAALVKKLPPPPTEEGVYPKFGILDFSNVSVSLLAKTDPSPGPFQAPSILQTLSKSGVSSKTKNRHECIEDSTAILRERDADRNTEQIYGEFDTCKAMNNILIATMDVPNKVFDSLREDTRAAGHTGIEQMNVHSVIDKALMQGLRRHVLGEEYVRSAISKALRDVDSFKEYAVGQLKKYGVRWNMFDLSVLADVRESWMQGLEQVQEDWTALTSKMMK